ncbi:unnamed protein product [Prunus brigantina]
MCSPKTRALGSSFSVYPDYITGSGVDNHAVEVRNKFHPFAKKNLDENVLHLFENTLVLGPHWFGSVPTEMAELMKKDAEAPLCFQSIKWVDWIDRLLPRYGTHWRGAGIYDAIILSRQSINMDENLLAAALCFWNSASTTFDFRIGPMAPTLLDMAQIFGFRPHGRPVDAVAFGGGTAQPHRCWLWTYSFGSSFQESVLCHSGESLESVCSRCVLDDPDLAAGLLSRTEVSRCGSTQRSSSGSPIDGCRSAQALHRRIADVLQVLHQEISSSMAGGDQENLSLVPAWIQVV